MADAQRYIDQFVNRPDVVGDPKGIAGLGASSFRVVRRYSRISSATAERSAGLRAILGIAADLVTTVSENSARAGNQDFTLNLRISPTSLYFVVCGNAGIKHRQPRSVTRDVKWRL